MKILSKPQWTTST